jgi:hypothetical protein
MGTFIGTLIICLIMVGGMMWLASSRARVSLHETIELLEWVLLGQANENAWEVFCSLAIYHDETIEGVRRECAAINEAYQRATSNSDYLLNSDGLDRVRRLLNRLKLYELSLEEK